MTILIIGATGTLGRQLVRESLNKGYQVRCLVRNIRKAVFLKEWGAELIYGDLSIPETIPPTLYNITAIIDASAARPSDSYSMDIIDYTGKTVLIEAAKKAKIKKFIFCSLVDCDNKLNNKIHLIQLKNKIENILKESTLNYTIFRIEGFFQGLINQYALPILENQSIWITKESKAISYINSQDAAKFIIRSLDLYTTEKKIFNLIGRKAWSSKEIISLCEKLSGKKAKISYISILSLKILRQLTQLLAWTRNISDRLALIEVLSISSNSNIIKSIETNYKIFHFSISEISSLEEYLQEYFTSILKKIKELNYEKKENISVF
uniref:NmrA-like domain-containing protein n=1 Tax=Compsopogon caeruleus TaxID=31354 RepID=A0A1Z1XAX3_9RHOD|nr:hypothetical protein [Compsopogon caeruleus]ARX96004.1 hypothetical protein [Compsopogon caeruleus]